MPRFRPHEKPKTLKFGPFGPRNMKEVYQFIDFSPSISSKQSDERLGGLLMLAGLHAAYEGEPPLDVLARIPANVPLLRHYLTKAPAKKNGYTDGSWRNMRRHIFASLRVSGVRVRQGRCRVPLPEPFQTFCDRLTERQRKGLYPFLRWAVEDGIVCLSEFTPRLFDRYAAYLDAFDGRERRRNTFTEIVRVWNLVRDGYPDAGLSFIPLVSQHDRYALDWSTFPPAHSGDLDQPFQRIPIRRSG